MPAILEGKERKPWTRRPLSERQKLTPPEVAKLWGVDVLKILAWVRTGELTAINAATNPRKRAKYLIDKRDIADFESRRAVVAPAKTAPRRRRSAAGVKEYF